MSRDLANGGGGASCCSSVMEECVSVWKCSSTPSQRHPIKNQAHTEVHAEPRRTPTTCRFALSFKSKRFSMNFLRSAPDPALDVMTRDYVEKLLMAIATSSGCHLEPGTKDQ